MRHLFAIRLLYLVIDVIGVVCGVLSLYYLRFHYLPNVFQDEASTPTLTPYANITLVIAAIWVIIAISEGLYSIHNTDFAEELVSIVVSSIVSVGVMAVALTLLKMSYHYSRFVIFGSALTSSLIVATFRYFLTKLILSFEAIKVNALIITNQENLSPNITRGITNQRWCSFVGVVMGKEKSAQFKEIQIGGTGFSVLGDITNLSHVTQKYNIKEVHLVLYTFSSEEILTITTSIEGDIHVINIHPDPTEIVVADTEIQLHNGAISLMLRQNLVNPFFIITKRLFDFLFSFIVVLMLSPFFLFVALLIKLSSRGPVFYKQRRLGKLNKPFYVYKFRTMVKNADEVLKKMFEENPALKEEFERDFKLKNDPRITAIGRFLRKTSLDELPQFFNALGGSMSVVGPRPIVESEVGKYEVWSNLLFRAKPGITGLWQVSGRNDITYIERVMLDRFYIKNWSLRLDFVIILKTIAVMFGKRGAY